MNYVSKFGIGLLIIMTIMFFSVQVQKLILFILQKTAVRIGTGVQETELSVKRYIFTHYDSLVAKLYRWLNDQIIALGLKKYEITPVGFLVFLGIVALPITLIIAVVLKSGFVFSLVIYVTVVVTSLLVTRMKTANSIENRENNIMISIDMIVPDIGSGVHNAINKYVKLFPHELQQDYKIFLDRISKGYTFQESMILLSDSIGGNVFKDFAQKAIYYEENGQKESIDIFTDIVETNRLRRELRYENRKIFNDSKTDLLTASAFVWGYVFLFGIKEVFTYNFMFKTRLGQALFVLDITIQLAAMVYMTTLRSREI